MQEEEARMAFFSLMIIGAAAGFLATRRPLSPAGAGR
jgi:hypothetical protein